MNGKLKKAFSTSIVLVITTFQTPVNSETVCKGLVEDNCVANASCIWVNGYVTKKGAQVSGYCRVKPDNRSSSSKAQSSEDLKQTAQDS